MAARYSMAAFLALWTAGIFSLTGGRLLTRLRWRDDIPPFRRQTGLIELAVHPERYAIAEALPLIRFLTGAGIVLMTAGLTVLVNSLIYYWSR